MSWVIVLLKEMYLNILTIAKNTLRATKALACVEETSFYFRITYLFTMWVSDSYRSAGIGQHAEVRVLIRLAEEVVQLVLHVERHVVVVYHRDDGQLKWRAYFKLTQDVSLRLF